jgi:hypothetical protein
MSDINPDVPDKPIVVPESPTGTQVATGTRDILLIVAALPALVAVLGTRDVKQIVDWFAGQEGLAFVAVMIAVGTPLWRQWNARRKHADLKLLETKVPDSIAVKK